MCYSPLHLPNNSRQFNLSKDRLYLNVPCGNCGECRKKKSDDVTARLYYEYLDCEKTSVPDLHYDSPDGRVHIHGHGYAFLQTLTYNDDMVPWLHGIMCFRPDDYRRFMVNLRHDLEQRGKLMKGDKMKIKVYWVSEYGGQTYRPHYHPLFFVRMNVNPEELEDLCRHNWAIVARKKNKDGVYPRTSLGWTDVENPYSDKHTHPSQLVIDGHVAVMNYVSQYIGKDIDFEKVLADQKSSHYDDLPISDDDYKMLKPFTRQSNGIGECIKDMVTVDELMDGRITIPDTLQGSKVVSLPLYIDRKVYYDYNPDDKCFRLNADGYKMKMHRLEHNRGYVKKQIDYLKSNISVLWTDRASDIISDLLPKFDVYDTPAKAMMKVSDVLYNRYDDFIDYILYYKDISSTYRYQVDNGCDLKELASSMIIKREPPTEIERSTLLNLRGYSIDDPEDYNRVMKHFYGCDCQRFKDFEVVLGILNGINMSFCFGRQKEYLKRKAEKSRQKKLYNKLHSKQSFHSLNRF